MSNPTWQISVLERVTLNYERLGPLGSPFTSLDSDVQNLLTTPWLSDKALRMYGRKRYRKNDKKNFIETARVHISFR